jgi:fructose-1-phosphate kinase PfkB-like protein
LVSGEEAWMADLPQPERGTTSGVWDALIAGFVCARLEEQPDREALHLGAADAAFAASQVGNEFGTREQAADYLDQIDVQDASQLTAEVGRTG